MRDAAVPYLLGELEQRSDFWFAALREITGDDPVQDYMRGNFEQMRGAWLDWAAQRGIVIDHVGQTLPQPDAA
jgi:hypothetical protein